MANQQHLDVLKQGAEAWNTWRKEHPDIQPDLSKANLKEADLNNNILWNANFSDANLSEAYLSEVWTAPLLPDHGSSQISQSERYTVKNSQEKEKRDARKNIQSRIQAHDSATAGQWRETTGSNLSRT